MYYNTTNEQGDALLENKRTANLQDTKIFRLFRTTPRSKRGASDVHQILFGNGTPITSVRRSLNTLAADGKIEKLDEKQIGPYGRPEHLWRLKR